MIFQGAMNRVKKAYCQILGSYKDSLLCLSVWYKDPEKLEGLIIFQTRSAYFGDPQAIISWFSFPLNGGKSNLLRIELATDLIRIVRKLPNVNPDHINYTLCNLQLLVPLKHLGKSWNRNWGQHRCSGKQSLLASQAALFQMLKLSVQSSQRNIASV